MPDTSPQSPVLRRFLIIGALLCLLAVSPSAYRSIKKHRASRLAEKSLELSRSGQTEAARDAAEAAFNLSPASPSSLRARMTSAASPTDAFFFGSALIDTDAATPDDVRSHLRTCLQLDFASQLDHSLQRLLDAEPENIENWLLATEINLRRGQSQLALNCVERALQIDPGNRLARMLTARVALNSSEESFRAAAQRTLTKLISEAPDDGTSLEAQLALLPESADELRRHPLATVTHQLLAAQHLVASAADLAIRKRIVQETIDRHSSDSLPALIHWLNNNQEAERSLQLVDFEKARSSGELFTTWCHAMLAENRSAELIAIIEDPTKHSQIPLPTESRQLVLVDAYERSEKPELAEIHWGKAMRSATSGNRRGKILRLAQWAERHNYANRAIDLYRILLSDSPEAIPHWYDRIAELARSSEQLPLLREITAGLHARTPENLVYQHNFAYLSALAGEDLDEAAILLNSLIDRAPQAGSARCALALTEIRRGNTEAAREQLSAITPGQLDPNSMYVYQRLQGNSPQPPASITDYEIAALKFATD